MLKVILIILTPLIGGFILWIQHKRDTPQWANISMLLVSLLLIAEVIAEISDGLKSMIDFLLIPGLIAALCALGVVVERMVKIDRDKGWLYPLVNLFIRGLTWISPLKWLIFFNKKWEKSRTVVDTYVTIWICLIMGIFLFFQFGQVSEVSHGWLLFFTFLLIWRLFDILLAWCKTLLFPPFGKTSAPRLIILSLLNYIEITVLFGILGFLHKSWPYYDKCLSRVQVIDGIRASFGIITPLGVGYLPFTFSVGKTYYLEYVIGLFFLLIIINRALGYYRND